ncbi:thioredoxin-like protein [Amylocystis lapponica]|nr:thioredoxin-like protein [Amylocystis lapponica]
MFGAFKRSIPQISIFHNPASPPSTASLRLLRAALSAPYPPSKPSSPPLSFNLDVIENTPPTADQLRTILSYLPSSSTAHAEHETASPVSLLSAHPAVHSRPTSPEGVARLAAQNLHALKWPIVVDWDHGRAAVGDVEGVKGILEEIRKRRDGEAPDAEEHKPKGWFS